MSVFTVGVVGPSKAGKSQICSRLVSHKFDPVHKETKEQTQYFLRCQQKSVDAVVCLEDTEPSGVLRTKIFDPKFWFESDVNFDDDHDAAAKKKKKDREAVTQNPLHSHMHRKRDAIIVVFALDSKDSFTEAMGIVNDLFDRLGFKPSGWKRAPLATILIGNKSDAVGKKREVTQEEIDSFLQGFVSKVLVDPKTGGNVQHVQYFEVSAKMGTGCEGLISSIVQSILKRPSKAEVNTPDTAEGMWGSLLQKHEWARVVNQELDGFGRSATKAKKKVSKFFRPILRMKWLPKMPTIPKIPVPPAMKIFPNKLWICFCLRKDAEVMSDTEDQALIEEVEEEYETEISETEDEDDDR